MNLKQQVQNTIQQSIGTAKVLPVVIDVVDTQTLTITATFLPQDYVDQQQTIIDTCTANIDTFTQAIADRQAEITGYTQDIVDQQTILDTAQANIDSVVKSIPGLTPVSTITG